MVDFPEPFSPIIKVELSVLSLTCVKAFPEASKFFHRIILNCINYPHLIAVV